MDELQIQTPPPFTGVQKRPAEEGYIGPDVQLEGYGFIPVADLRYRGTGYKVGMILLIVALVLTGVIACSKYIWDHTPSYNSVNDYVSDIGDTGTTMVGELILMLFLGLAVLVVFRSKFWAVKSRVFRGAAFVQADLESNGGFPFVMTDGRFGVVNTEMRREIIRPEYDSIRYYPGYDYFECRRGAETVFFSSTGRRMK